MVRVNNDPPKLAAEAPRSAETPPALRQADTGNFWLGRGVEKYAGLSSSHNAIKCNKDGAIMMICGNLEKYICNCKHKKYFYKYINNNRTLSSNTVRVVPVVGVGVAVSVVQVGGVAGAGGQQPGQQLGEVEQRGVHTWAMSG